MTFEKTFIYEKLECIFDHLENAKRLLKFSDKEILDDFTKMHSLERIFQLIVDAAIDINQHFIKELNFDISNDLQGTFYILGENKILPGEFAFKIAPVVGVRNRIVHGYETLNKKLFIKNFRENYSDFEKYIKLIEKYLE